MTAYPPVAQSHGENVADNGRRRSVADDRGDQDGQAGQGGQRHQCIDGPPCSRVVDTGLLAAEHHHAGGHDRDHHRAGENDQGLPADQPVHGSDDAQGHSPGHAAQIRTVHPHVPFGVAGSRCGSLLGASRNWSSFMGLLRISAEHSADH